jgi:hypothetical protein
MDLQKEWKTVGACAPRDEQKLWRRFRKAQDTFFNGRKAEMAGKIEGEKENLKQKNALIEEVKAFQISGKRKDDLDALKAFSVRWNAIGFVPRKSLDKVMEAYRTAMDAHYDALSAQKSERAMETYKQRVDNLLEADTQSIRREQRILREKLDRRQGCRKHPKPVREVHGGGQKGSRRHQVQAQNAPPSLAESRSRKSAGRRGLITPATAAVCTCTPRP